MTAENDVNAILFEEFMYKDVAVLTISAFGTVLNTLLFIAFIKDPLKCFRNSGTYFVMNLSISDSLTCLFALFFQVIPFQSKWNMVIDFSYGWFATASFLWITSVSIDRFLTVAYPIKYRILIKGKLICVWLISIWITSCIFPILRVVLTGQKDITRILFFMIGIIIIIFTAVMYSLTYVKLKKNSRNIVLQYSNENRSLQTRMLKERRFLNTTVIIAFIAFISTLPSMVFFSNFLYFGFGL